MGKFRQDLLEAADSHLDALLESRSLVIQPSRVFLDSPLRVLSLLLKFADAVLDAHNLRLKRLKHSRADAQAILQAANRIACLCITHGGLIHCGMQAGDDLAGAAGEHDDIVIACRRRRFIWDAI